MQKNVLILLGVIAFLTHCNQSPEEKKGNENTNTKLEIADKNKDLIKSPVNKNTAEIIVGNKKLTVLKKEDYDYELKVFTTGKEIADTSVHTGFAPSYVYYDENYFVMDVDAHDHAFVVYDAKKNIFRKYKGYWASTMSFRIIDEKLYIGYFAFDVQAGSLLVIDLSSGERKHYHNIEGETITSAEIKATSQNNKVYALMDYSSDQKVYSITEDGLKNADEEIFDSFENKKLSELFK